MKGTCMFLIMLLLVSAGGFTLDISVGVKGGVNHSSYIGQDYQDSLDSSPDLSNAFNLGFQGGAFVTLGILDAFAIQPEVIIARTGDMSKEDVEPTYEGFVRYFDHLLYWEPAVLIVGRFGKFNVFAGPLAMIRMTNGIQGYKADDSAIGSDKSNYGDDDLTKALFAAAAGFSYLYSLGPGSLVFELRGRYCFQNILNEDVSVSVLNQYAVMVMVGYSYPFFK